ncbi:MULTISPECIES: SPOR domain-containing protein [Legionella]|uniref:SPOR domain-containing protein n=1 Tax=Legionella resiliens TaxID=2905958 RepID=A0ABS8X9K0_9GAMM|nr:MULTISPECIES: SPOR domain-containing protein [unclassified Legionella]MCE0724552.1 SPOR domain-containing protein [Legionella sp. 9fVS26]MCE3533705.1 SPOR domain-containing protein [Legionella sp. 8cVS16]QLZ69897.1 SPOR domain-containing protein [Legionella sp. PC1000]
MTKEYGNRRSSRSRSSAPHQLLVSMFTFLLGYLTASFFDIETISHWVNSQVLAHQEIKKEPVKPEAQQRTAIPPKPKFEFYTLLANEKVPNSQANANSATSVQPAASVTTSTIPTTASTSTPKTSSVNVARAATTAAASARTNNSKAQQYPGAINKTLAPKSVSSTDRGKFLVQVASFKARKDAEQMKGTLILKGFSVYIVPVSHATKGNWFRVVVGPYPNRALAQQAQMILAKNEHLNGMVTSAG